ncbi:polypeptide N-acetylgalactosaminyltransferase 1-like isoform X1 [Biomphalaria glabrata]|uniref:Polypeptide N-acetylgalactosaminyltransferase n=1 Tax=Biomphalaria glabrata TaxID=6526 RepID=A0A9W2ZVL8_BIOGL|nr:polypeptide N-acetylgalactosaminyltransferase 1-like isoform X1 [Biomphalaria glabrata]XP_055878999.1 polypeptide N-acetylgalactosaminyltransferase 1-like isoform X1 [Biomphalaria glabrata]
MFIKRKKLKLLIVCGIFLFFYLYIFISSSRIDIFLSRSHQGNSLNGHNKTKVKSPFEGPVEDLLGGEFRINREHNDVINEDKKTNDHGWKKGFRVGAGFQNPLLNVGEVIKEKADDPMDGIEDEIIEDNLGHPKARAVKGPEFKPLQPIADKRSKKKKGHRKSDEDCCIEVKKKQKLYLHVTYPPFIQFGKPGDPGEDGQSVRWRPDELTRNESLQKEKDFNVHYFDEWTSRKIAVHRSLLDQRGPECRASYAYLPPVSVIIVFHNEAWTTLLRSIHSVLDRTPIYLLQEIVLLDDFSDMEHLQEPLEAYIQHLDKVKLFRATKRLGLIRARNTAFDHSKGRIVVFLDSHIECFPGWLEPLIAPIHNDSTAVTFPSIELINGRTFGTGMNTKLERTVGGLMVHSLSFNWLYERKHNISQTLLYYPSPTMPGGLYAVSREWFSKLGKYDPEMDFWGGENIEMSFKTWMCGGSLLLSVCSHVGHIFRNINPNIGGIRLTYKNSIRVAEVWMDQYKHFFYEKLGYNIPDYGDVTSRVLLRKSLNCSDFGWYLQHVFPELKKSMDVFGHYYGEIRSVSENVCLTRQTNTIGIDSCRLGAVTQQWQYGSDKRITSGEFILGVRSEIKQEVEYWHIGIFHDRVFDKTVFVYWIYENQRLVNKKTGLCLQVNTRSRSVELKNCSNSSEDQQWKLTTRKQNQDAMKSRGVEIDWSV